MQNSETKAFTKTRSAGNSHQALTPTTPPPRAWHQVLEDCIHPRKSPPQGVRLTICVSRSSHFTDSFHVPTSDLHIHNLSEWDSDLEGFVFTEMFQKESLTKCFPSGFPSRSRDKCLAITSPVPSPQSSLLVLWSISVVCRMCSRGFQGEARVKDVAPGPFVRAEATLHSEERLV